MNSKAGQQIQEFLRRHLPKMKTPADKKEWTKRSAQVRRDMLKLFFKGHPRGLLTKQPRVEWLGQIDDFKEYRIRKLRFEGYPGLWVAAFLYEPRLLCGPAPVALNSNGHHPGGNAMEYKQARCINLAKRGVPALSYEFIGMGESWALLPHNKLRLLDVCGVSGVGVFYLVMKRALDILLKHPMADRRRVLMTGLSGGGWQTAVLSALDRRITHIVPVAGHSAVWQRKDFVCDIGDSEQVPADFCTVADYDTLSAMFAPRPCLFIYNRNDDCCFRPERTRVSVYFPAREVYRLLGAEQNVGFYINKDPGTHNYGADNRTQLYGFMRRYMGVDGPDCDFPCDKEILTEQELCAGLPPDNATFESLAKDLLVEIRKKRVKARPGVGVQSRRRKLRETVKLPGYRVVSSSRGKTQKRRGVTVDSWNLSVGRDWVLPVKTAMQGKSEYLCIHLRNGGIPTARTLAERLVQPLSDNAELHVDLLGYGELACTNQYHMLVETAGERALGLQVAQVLAVADWAHKKFPRMRLKLCAGAEALSVVAIIAGALRPSLFKSIEVGIFRSLDTVVEPSMAYTDMNAPLFCFGLLKEFDLPELLALSGKTPVITGGRGPLKR